MIGVTGATGFVGRALCAHLAAQGMTVRRLLRQRGNTTLPDDRMVGEIGPDTVWSDALQGLDCVVHCAAHVHRMQAGVEGNTPADYRRVNTEGTRRLAEAAAIAGVRRFIFISSIKVLGEATSPGVPFRHDSRPDPIDPYGQSKWEAEQALWSISEQSGLQVAVIRPPLVYGPGVGANFLRLMRWIESGMPLPLASVSNLRSLVSVDNLVDLVAVCLTHPDAAGETFLASDGHDLSTPDLVAALGHAMGVHPRLWPAPVGLMRLAGRLTGRAGTVERLVQSLQVDIGHTCQHLGWTPPVSVEEGLARTVAGKRGVLGKSEP